MEKNTLLKSECSEKVKRSAERRNRHDGGELGSKPNGAMKNIVKYQIAADVFYRQYGDKTLLYRSDARRVSLFGGNLAEVLDFFREANTDTACLTMLKVRYGLSEAQIGQMRELLDRLAAEQILMGESDLLEDRDGVENYFQNHVLMPETLYSVLLELTYRCNEVCRHCYCVNDPIDELTTEEWKGVLDQLAAMNVLELVFTGGDLFVRKDAFEILEYAYSKRFLFTVFTNGIALGDSEILRLKACHPKSIHFSVYSHIPEKHDAFTQVKGSFEHTMSAIRRCLLVGIPVNIKTLAMNYNADDIEGIMALARKLGTTVQVGMAVNAKNDGDASPTQFRLDSVDAYEKIIAVVNRNIEFRCEREFEKERTKEDRLCGAGVNDLSIDPYGNVYPCNALRLACGNVRKQGIREIWERSPVFREVRAYSYVRLAGCESCPDWQFCNFCPGNAFSETGSALKRYEEACKITQAKKQAEIKQRRNV